jgi:hypothetical protein
MASCLTERKLDDASKPLIIPGNVFAHRSFAVGRESVFKESLVSRKEIVGHVTSNHARGFVTTGARLTDRYKPF